MTRPRRFLISGIVLLAIGFVLSTTMRAGENLDIDANGQIRDMFWDSRLFDGTPGFPGAIQWLHNPSGKPGAVNQAEFEARVEAGFNAWESVDDAFPEEPLVPIVNLGGQTTVTDPFALDGVNAIAWQAEAPGGTLAVTPCWVLTEPTTTVNDGAGHAALPLEGGGTIPFPGPIGVTYPVGTAVDCGMRFDSWDTWSTSEVPSASGFDVQSVATHEAGHFIGLSHSTLGDFSGVNAISATMLPFAAAGDDTFRSLEEDDRASVLRTYARNRHGGPLPQTIGGRAVIRLTLLKGAACEPVAGVSVVAYRTGGGIDGPGRVEMFSGSHLRAGIGDEPTPGAVSLNVMPLTPGESYTVYARTLEQGTGALSSQRYNYTTINANLIDPAGQSRTFDQLASIPAPAAGQTIELGNIGILGCWVPNPSSPINLVATSATAPVNGFRGGTIAVTSSFTNQGTVAVGAFQAGIYFSTDPTITAADIFSGFICAVPGLQPSASGTCNGSVSVPGAVLPGDYYVGVLVDRQNQVTESTENDNGISSGHLTAIAPNPLDPFVNGSFETGDLTGWSVKELTPASNPNLPLSVRGAGVEYPASTFIAWPYILDYFTSAPTDGQWAALHDFNGNDPSTSGATQYINRRELYQDVALPPGTTTLEFDYRAAWELFRFGSTRDRTFSVEVEPLGGGTTLLSRTILVAPNLTIEEDTENPSGGVGDYPPGVVDLSAFANQSVRVKFVWNIPEPGTGFGFFQLDNIRLNTLPNAVPVVDITAPANGATFPAGQSITLTGIATDAEDGDIALNILWSSSIDGDLGTGASLSTSTLSEGTHTITASIVDTAGQTGSASIGIIVEPVTGPNTAPVVTITAPDNGATFNGSASFAGTASDDQDGIISASLSWSSSLDGFIGSGASVTTNTLRVGVHLITASVTDTGGLSASDSITVNVNRDNSATGDFATTRGTVVSGNFQSTWNDDDVYESLREALTGGNPSRRRSQLEHTWTFNVTPGAQYVFKVNAYRAGTEDNFTFAYSRNNLTFTPMVTVTKTGDDDVEQAFVFPDDVSGTLYIRVQDTDSTQGNVQLDSLFVDFLTVSALATSSGGGGGGGGGSTVTLSATGRKVKGFQYVDLAWSGATTSTVSITRNGAWIATVPNTQAGGGHTDGLGSKGAGTYSYQVCEVGGTGGCSNVASVTF